MAMEERLRALEKKIAQMEQELTDLRRSRDPGAAAGPDQRDSYGEGQQLGQESGKPREAAASAPPAQGGYGPKGRTPEGYGQRAGMPPEGYGPGGGPSASPGQEGYGQRAGMPPEGYRPGGGPSASPGQEGYGQRPGVPSAGYGSGGRPPVPPGQDGYGQRPGVSPAGYGSGGRPPVSPGQDGYGQRATMLPEGYGPGGRPPEFSYTPPPPRPPIDWEAVARVWLPRVFIVVLLLGVLWGFSAAIAAGYINEPVRCLLGVIAAAVMYWLGERQIRGGRDALGQVLLGGAVALLMLSGFAAYTLYGLIPAEVAAVYYIGTVALGVYASLRHRSESLMVTAMVAGYLLPFLLIVNEPNLLLSTSYLTVFSVAMLVLSTRFEFRTAYGAAFGLLHLPLMLLSISQLEAERPLFLMAILIQHAALYILTVLYRRDQPSTYRQALLFTGFMVMAGWFYAMYGLQSPGMYGALIGVTALVYAGTAYWSYRQGQAAYAVYAVTAMAGVALWLLHTLQQELLAGALLLQGTAAIVLGLRLRSNLQFYSGLGLYLVGALAVISMPMQQLYSGETVSWVILLATLPVLYGYYVTTRREEASQQPALQLIMWAEGLLMLYFLTRVAQLLSASLTDEGQQLVVSGVWIVYAIAVIVVGMILAKARVRLAGVAFLCLTLLKIVFVDLPGLSTAVRAVLFIALGAAGIVASRLLYKKKE
ncbi:hypothetical protein PA598K_06429 [Paenibacillus sp. 598K]|uniref:DUF2339 domain-containing protein n=1 Tax=Paenibacillus sp. 598K TaxID=1117987 RepID=UPI000FF92883|nr:DUF2339 domain-containing protein [Paenibacillus sp. 598K]GBF77853.1 hypothetical protein PA598K_06429 [Paenibacillus sp. 598K]